mmetsp:Transcript_8137/g.15933  ORF Transcript_8137/g.15933 Transcript_8137/m.15933 type:complete len:219 (-) Transcript_8137:96-752(-)|eukprot:CAMPEP_0173383006 /NCGR_PEP_ID=MMETSP1356-20130122/5527_1 /TAXON_ID=77927 ORGANISM="Hemiselmis virescens, Strain PCC157" /NCGR_SAMPLE_ID=MMETSP1356 /ASSEMBLY_ACC=CAM_ASM_000847 /LENGTH=218 /DNA_ID=CAMNT_0014337643 /DNA_START=102 /DNA_END=758 /DNA_ORIENTATION=-
MIPSSRTPDTLVAHLEHPSDPNQQLKPATMPAISPKQGAPHVTILASTSSPHRQQPQPHVSVHRRGLRPDAHGHLCGGGSHRGDEAKAQAHKPADDDREYKLVLDDVSHHLVGIGQHLLREHTARDVRLAVVHGEVSVLVVADGVVDGPVGHQGHGRPDQQPEEQPQQQPEAAPCHQNPRAHAEHQRHFGCLLPPELSPAPLIACLAPPPALRDGVAG